MTQTNDNAKTGVFLIPKDEVRRPQTTRIIALCANFSALLIIGLINLYSASLQMPYFFGQLRNLVVVLLSFFLFGWIIPIRRVASGAYWFYAGTCMLLILVIFLGKIAGGAQRWVSLGFITFQPSEFAKLSTALVVARFFQNNRSSLSYRVRDLWRLLLLIGVMFILIFGQPDFGTAGMCLLIALCQLFFVRIDGRSIWMTLSALPVAGLLGWTLFLKDYQKLRILNLFNPNLDPQNTGYHSLQSLIAIGSGGFFGKGYMHGTQAQLKFLPERHTDFIFSVFAEEHGFLGGVVVFILFASLTYITLSIARHARDTFSGFLAIGISSLIFIEFVINIAMVLGIFPVVGLPLPFFSYGSSSLLTICTGLGLLVAIERANLSK